LVELLELDDEDPLEPEPDDPLPDVLDAEVLEPELSVLLFEPAVVLVEDGLFEPFEGRESLR